MSALTPTCASPARKALTVGGFLALWVGDADRAGRMFLSQGRPIVGALFGRWRLSADEAEDAIQDGLLRAFADDMAALRRADPQVLFSAWLHGLLRNLAREAVRRQVALRGAGPGELASALLRRAGCRARREERARELPQVALLALTLKELEAYELHMDGLSTAQIAGRLGVGREAVRERIARAWVALANAAAGIAPPRRSTLRGLSLAETKTLPARSQQAHALWCSGLSYAAIAKTLGCSESAARGLLRRLKRVLKEANTGGSQRSPASASDVRDPPPPCSLSLGG